MCIGKNNDKNKTDFPLPPSTRVTVFLSDQKFLSQGF